ncbi:MAG: hypothetical protein ACRD07_10765 [Acidimicrobiales bacterium]
MTKVTAQMSISLEGCYAGPMDRRDPQVAAGWMQGPEAPGLFRVTRWVTDATGWRERQGLRRRQGPAAGDGTCLYDVADGSVPKLQNLGRR